MFWTDKNWWRKSSAWDAASDSAEAVGMEMVLMSVVMRLAEVREWRLWWRAVSRLLYAVHFDWGGGGNDRERECAGEKVRSANGDGDEA